MMIMVRFKKRMGVTCCIGEETQCQDAEVEGTSGLTEVQSELHKDQAVYKTKDGFHGTTGN